MTKIATFEEVCRPVMEWLAKNRNPHCKVIIDSGNAELVEGTVSFNTEDYIND